MPLISILQPEKQSKLALWEISEDEDYFSESLSLSAQEAEQLRLINNKNRRLEWLCTRNLLKQVLNKQIRIKYDTHHKPYIENNSFNISISHSKNIVGIYLNKEKYLGLDIEEISNKIDKVSSKFLSLSELDSIPLNDRIRILTIYWCAKETILKIHGKKDIDFKNQIQILPFANKKEGDLIGLFHSKSKIQTMKLKYFQYNNHIILYGVKYNS